MTLISSSDVQTVVRLRVISTFTLVNDMSQMHVSWKITYRKELHDERKITVNLSYFLKQVLIVRPSLQYS